MGKYCIKNVTIGGKLLFGSPEWRLGLNAGFNELLDILCFEKNPEKRKMHEKEWIYNNIKSYIEHCEQNPDLKNFGERADVLESAKSLLNRYTYAELEYLLLTDLSYVDVPWKAAVLDIDVETYDRLFPQDMTFEKAKETLEYLRAHSFDNFSKTVDEVFSAEGYYENDFNDESDEDNFDDEDYDDGDYDDEDFDDDETYNDEEMSRLELFRENMHWMLGENEENLEDVKILFSIDFNNIIKRKTRGAHTRRYQIRVPIRFNICDFIGAILSIAGVNINQIESEMSDNLEKPVEPLDDGWRHMDIF